jgi:hypothetical protein
LLSTGAESETDDAAEGVRVVVGVDARDLFGERSTAGVLIKVLLHRPPRLRVAGCSARAFFLLRGVAASGVLAVVARDRDALRGAAAAFVGDGDACARRSDDDDDDDDEEADSDLDARRVVNAVVCDVGERARRFVSAVDWRVVLCEIESDSTRSAGGGRPPKAKSWRTAESITCDASVWTRRGREEEVVT